MFFHAAQIDWSRLGSLNRWRYWALTALTLCRRCQTSAPYSDGMPETPSNIQGSALFPKRVRYNVYRTWADQHKTEQGRNLVTDYWGSELWDCGCGKKKRLRSSGAERMRYWRRRLKWSSCMLAFLFFFETPFWMVAFWLFLNDANNTYQVNPTQLDCGRHAVTPWSWTVASVERLRFSLTSSGSTVVNST